MFEISTTTVVDGVEKEEKKLLFNNFIEELKKV
jgi:hypothetical protein